MYSNSIRILIGVVFIVCVVGGVMVFKGTYAKSTTNQNYINSPNYPENGHGQTYGLVEEVPSVEMLPDLILAGSVNGIKAYLLKKDYLGEPGNVPLYDVNGRTITGSFHIGAKNMKFPKNKNGQTYGSSADATSPETEPELISAMGVDGTTGYVLKKDLDGEQPKSPEDALAIQISRSPGGRDIPLYDVDGETVIGVFHVGGE
ncbi:hypothetical protein [Paenibacillus guangzhouensis]|uniref:hypothetical protein n=1 Tax=Paenibacillus guangzhouensis TaxID=1473112 RepID=UPI001266BC79|nr:hypothetical protein [Paenibacillus guangzhouensis]